MDRCCLLSLCRGIKTGTRLFSVFFYQILKEIKLSEKIRFEAIMKKLVFSFILVLICLLQIQCERKPTAPEIIIPTTVGKGAGGHFNLSGKIETWQPINDFRPVTDVNLYILNNKDYSDTLAYLFVTSTDASFKISNLPEATVDIIITANHILPDKWSDFELIEQNQFTTFRVFERDLQKSYSPIFWMITRFDSDINVVESAVKNENCRIDTMIVKEPTDKSSRQRWFLLFSNDEQPIPEKLEAFIFLQPVLYLWGYADWHHLP